MQGESRSASVRPVCGSSAGQAQSRGRRTAPDKTTHLRHRAERGTKRSGGRGGREPRADLAFFSFYISLRRSSFDKETERWYTELEKENAAKEARTSCISSAAPWQASAWRPPSRKRDADGAGRGVRQPRFPAERIQPPAGRAAARRRLAPVGAWGAPHGGPDGLPITQAHASWEQAIPDDLHYESPYEIYERTMEACAILGCRQLIFHPVLYLHRMPDRSLWPRIHDWNVRWFHELLPLAEKFDHCDQSGKHVRLSPSAAAGRRARALHNRPRHAGARLRHWLEPCAALPRHRPCPHQRAGRARR